jgi:hypothetical protein
MWKNCHAEHVKEKSVEVEEQSGHVGEHAVRAWGEQSGHVGDKSVQVGEQSVQVEE